MASDAAIVILEHISCEPAGAYEDELRDRGLAFQRVRLDRAEALPRQEEVGAIVAMGGPMGVYDEAIHPWLGAEKRFIADAVADGRPYWGVCLGAQLLAASMGAAVSSGAAPEVGVGRVELSESAAGDPVFAAAPAAFDALHWHGDTYELPPGAIGLASSAQYRQQAFVLNRAYALQFHLEVTPALAQEWLAVPAYRDSLREVMGADGPARLLGQLERAAPSAIELGRRLFGRWLDHVVAGA
jgi:GMP synthase-like glutamine amidotransferase